MTLLSISSFSNETDKYPGRADVDWNFIVGMLADVRACGCTLASCTRSGFTLPPTPEKPDGENVAPCPHKYGPGWAPAAWPPGHTRKVWNVECVSALVVDLDHVKPHELGGWLRKIAPYRIVLHSSHSDRPDDRCLRVVFALSRPVAGPDWPRFWTQAITMLGLPADTKCRDGSRLYFRPSRPADACHPSATGDGYTFDAQDGAVLDVEAILAAAPAVEPVEFEEYEVPEFAGLPPMEKVVEAVNALARAWPAPGRNRHEAHLALAGALARAGWPAETIADFATTVANAHIAGSGNFGKRIKAARSSVEKAQTGALIMGWPRLQSILDEAGNDGRAAVEAATEALGLRRGPKLEDGVEFAAFAETIVPSRESAVDAILGGGASTHAPVYPPSHAVTPPMYTTAAPVAPVVEPPTKITLDAHLKGAQRQLAARKDADSIRDAELLRRIERGQFVTDDESEDVRRALCFAALAICRSVPDGTTVEQIVHRMAPSAGKHIDELHALVTATYEKARTMGPILAHRPTLSVTPGAIPLDEFKLKKSGDNAGFPDPSIAHNYDVALMRLGVRFRFNAFTQCELIERDGVTDIVQDHHIKGLAFEIEQKFGFYPPETKWRAYCDTVARKDSFHPVLDYLDTLAPDAPAGSPPDLTSTWLIRFAGAPDTPFVREISRIMLVAAVRRVRQPGCLFQEMLILESPQGKGKSTGLRALVPNGDWFTDDFRLDSSESRKMIEMTTGHWIIEAGELRGMSAGDHNALKQYLSRLEDKARMAYGHKTQIVKRQFVTFGSTNDFQYLKDPTGNRRYWPIRITEFDVAGLIAVRDQLWAEAARLDLEHPEKEYIRLPPELYAAAEEEQRKRAVDDPYEIMLATAIGPLRGRLPVPDAWKLVGFHEEKLPNKNDTQAITIAMVRLGWSREEYRTADGTPVYLYARGTDEERELDLAVVGSSGQGWRVRPTVLRELQPASNVPPRPASVSVADQTN